MKLVYHTLPVSGFTVGVNVEPLFGEIEDIDNFFSDNLAIPFKTDSGTDKEQESVMGEFKGKLMSKKKDTELNTLIRSIKNLDEIELVVIDGNGLSNALTIVRGLAIADGKFVRGLVATTLEEIKKNY